MPAQKKVAEHLSIKQRTFPAFMMRPSDPSNLSQLKFPMLIVLLFVCASIWIPRQMQAQDAKEALGPKDSIAARAETPLLLEMKTLRSNVLPELTGVHPRVYFTDQELDVLRAKAHGPLKAWWKEQLQHLRALQGPPPPPPAEKRRDQNDVAFAIAEAAFAYKIEGDPKYLAAAKQYMDAAVSYDVWGYSFSK